MTKGLPVQLKNLHFTTVLDVRRARSDERVARGPKEFAFHHSFGGLLWRREKIAFHHSFGRPTITFCVKGRSASSRICISPQFWASDEHEVTRGLSPAATYTKPTLRKRKEETLKRSSIFEEQRSQQLFSAGFQSSLSQQLFSAGFLSSFSQQPFSAAFLSSLSQQLFSAAFLSSSSQQFFSAAFLSSSSQLSSCCGQGLVVS